MHTASVTSRQHDTSAKTKHGSEVMKGMCQLMGYIAQSIAMNSDSGRLNFWLNGANWRQ